MDDREIALESLYWAKVAALAGLANATFNAEILEINRTILAYNAAAMASNANRDSILLQILEELRRMNHAQ